ncbi:hypothetical protein LPJ57_000161 [Coemansia sp. RSA 486]|nr:hypothetical protein LPJ57_000161 [Coemansia sp. RSA 486]KAJ2237789.1 hypothetical protein IWW45_000677 [Coemansia sp. RSA 485]
MLQAFVLCMLAVCVLGTTALEAGHSDMSTVTAWSTSYVLVNKDGELAAQPTMDYIPVPTGMQLADTYDMIPLPILNINSQPLSSSLSSGVTVESELGSVSESESDVSSGLDTLSDTVSTSSENMSASTFAVDEYTISSPLSSETTAIPASSAAQAKIVVTVTHTVAAKELASSIASTHTPNAPSANTSPVVVNDWKNSMLSLLNQLRARYHKPALKLDDRLSYVAWAHSNYQYSIKNMTHNDILPVGDRVSNIGIKWAGIGENVAVGQKTVDEVMKGWTDSEKHFDNMIGDYDIVGFGMVSNYWTQDFVKQRA